jgi:hypothetical protein
MKLKTFKKGQGTLEYAIIIVVVVGALIAMEVIRENLDRPRMIWASSFRQRECLPI